jgi:ABC-2 type transport system permease protein
MRARPEATLAWLAVRQSAASRWSLWALLLALLPVLVALHSRGQGHDAAALLQEFGETFRYLIVPVLLPLVALVVGTGVFGNEVDDGTITFVLGKPVARWRILLTRVVAAGLLTALVVAPATLLSGLVHLGAGEHLRVVLAATAAVVGGSLLYCALFVAISLSTRRSLVTGLAYIVIWEGTLATSLAGTRALSVRQYTLSFADALARAPAEVFGARLEASTAWWMALALATAATAHAIRRLRSFEIGEAT